MASYFITGNAGTGKSSVIRVLQERGFTAYDIDEHPDIHAFIDTKDNSILDNFPEVTSHGSEAFTRYDAIFKESVLKQLLDSDKTVFLSGSSTLQAEFYPLFHTIFGLVLPLEMLDQRLATRTNNPTGANPADRAYLLNVNDDIEAKLHEAGAVMIDASQPIEKVVDEITGYVSEG